jgi:hypothetical protein
MPRCDNCLERDDVLVDGECIECFRPEWPAWAAELLFEIETWTVTMPWRERLAAGAGA